MVEMGGSQCGYCTPGIIMSLFSLYKNKDHPTRAEVEDALTGNLCRCTGYKPIVESAARSCVYEGNDHFTSLEPQISNLLKSIPRETLHIKTGRQDYFQPRTLTEALKLLKQYPDFLVLCGATDVALRVTKRHEVLKQVLDLSAIDELKAITANSSSLTIGAGVSLSHAMPKVQADFPALFEMLSVFGSQQIRNLATFGGNLGTASPIGDTLPVLMAYDAKAVLQSAVGKREVSIDDFIVGYRKTARRPDELITAIVLPKNSNGARVKSYKISKRKDLDISTVSAGFRLELNGGSTVKDVKLVFGGMAETTKRAASAEKFLLGKPWRRGVIEEAMSLVDKEFSPIADARSGAEFRKVAARNLLLKFWTETS